MITKDNFKDLLTKLGFTSKGDTFTKKFKEIDAYLKVDFKVSCFKPSPPNLLNLAFSFK
jgi:hypothetical protein